MEDLKRAYGALAGKLDHYTSLINYYDGTQPLVYSTDRLKEAFNNINASFNQNWVSVVIDSALDRLIFKGWKSDNSVISKKLSAIYSTADLQIESYDVHKTAMITHEAFVIAWRDDTNAIEVYYNDPRMCHMFYETDNPKRKQFAAKWYVDDDMFYHMVLYYPDRIEYYRTVSPVKQGVPRSYRDFVPEELPVAENPFGEIPVFHFRTDRRGKTSDVSGIITLQDAVNKLLADMMVSAEFGAFKQRYIITNSDTRSLKNAPNEIWTIPSGDGTSSTSVGQFQETDLNVFLGAIDKIANSIAIISRTPKHYFFGAGGSISGEALIAMESPMVSKVERHQTNFGMVWIDLAHFLLRLEGSTVEKQDIDVVWEPAQSVQPLTEAQTIKTNVEAGVPLESALRWSGKNDFEIMLIMEELADQKAGETDLAKAVLDRVKVASEQSTERVDGSHPTDESHPNDKQVNDEN